MDGGMVIITKILPPGAIAFTMWPWRRKWETEAYIAQGLDKQSIAVLLKGAPYYLK